MTRTVLILTEPGDGHAYAVAEALRRKGAVPMVWHTADFPSLAGESVLFEGSRRRTTIRGGGIELEQLESMDTSKLSIWHRRPAFAVNHDALHPADGRFAELECAVFRRSLFRLLADQGFWVNPPGAAAHASSKLIQHQAALDVGFAVPATLYSNDPDEIRSFMRAQGGTIVYKPFRGLPWRSEATSWVPFTSLLTEDLLVPDATLRNVPGIYQERVAKAFELRVTVIGDRVLAAKVHSQQTSEGTLDWRRSYAELAFSPYELEPTTSELCLSLLRRLGLVFGCFDFIVTPAQEYVFLEVNEMGQFLFVETYAGLPLLDAFSEFLMQGRPDFEWRLAQPHIHYSEVAEQTEAEVRISKLRYVRPPMQFFREEIGGKS